MPVIEQSGMRLEYPVANEQPARTNGTVKLLVGVSPRHVNHRVWVVYRLDDGQWARRQATRELASTDPEHYSLVIDVSAARIGLRYLAFVRSRGITVPKGADSISPDEDSGLSDLTVHLSLARDGSAENPEEVRRLEVTGGSPRLRERKESASITSAEPIGLTAKPGDSPAIRPIASAGGVSLPEGSHVTPVRGAGVEVPSVVGVAPTLEGNGSSSATDSSSTTERTGEDLMSGHFVVRGHVTGASERQFLSAYDHDFRSEELLGKSPIDDRGNYEIGYTADQFKRAEKRTADLRVAVCGADGAELVSSNIYFNAGPETTIDLAVGLVPDVLSEYERHMADLEEVLQDVSLFDIAIEESEKREKDLDFLAGDTGIDRQHIEWLIQAAKLASEVGSGTEVAPPITARALMAAPQRSGIPAEAFYGWFRQGIPSEPAMLWARSTVDLVVEIERAIRANVVPRDLLKHLDEIRDALEELRTLWTLKPATEGMRASLGDVLRTIPDAEQLTGTEQLEFARIYAEHGASNTLWDAIADSQLASKRPVLQRSFALRNLTDGHAPMMVALQERAAESNSDTLAYLASVSSKEWLNLAFEHDAPRGAGLSPAEYAAYLERSVEKQYPTEVLRQRLESGTLRIANFPSELLSKFLTSHRDFDLKTHDVNTYLDSAAIDSPELRDGLKQVKRVLPLTNRIDATAALLGEGLTSRYKIASAGVDLLQAQLRDKIDDDLIRDIHSDAVASADSALALSTILFPVFYVSTYVFPKRQPNAEGSVGATLRSLFGDIGFCECRHCQSVLGPAAYLADLLHFMETSPTSLGGSVLDAMLTKRPDVIDLELSCENTNTEIPYIDLVLEILESAVALPLGVPLTTTGALNIEDELTHGRVPDAIKTALRKTAITIGDSLTPQRAPMLLIQVSPRRSEWIISDGSRRWRIAYQPRQLIGWRDVSANFRPSIFPPAFAQLDAIEAGLQAGSLHPDLLAYLAPDPFPPVKGVPQVTAVATTPSAVPGWSVSIRQEIQVEIVPGTPMGAVRIYVGTQTPTALQMPTGQWQLIAAWLAGTSRNPDAALTLLGLPRTLAYKVSLDAATNRSVVQVDTNVLLAIAPESLTITALTYQDSSILTNLTATPENRDPEAYEKLRQHAVFPWNLPFDLWLEETRAFLEALGVPRVQLIDLARPQSRLSEEATTLELLGLSKAEADLIATGAAASAESWTHWGLKEQSNTIRDHIAGQNRNGTWQQVLSHLSMLLQQSGLSYREYLDLLQTKFVRPGVPALAPPDECKTSKITLTDLTPTELAVHLNRAHIFTRLWRKSGWSMQELDLALAAFTQPPLQSQATPIALQGLAIVKRLQADLRLPVRILTGCIDTLDVEDWTDHIKEGAPVQPALYDTIFQRQSLRSLPGFEDFKIANLATRISVPSYRLDFVAASLGIKPDQLKRWISGTPSLGMPNGDFAAMDTLSCLYTAAALCRALQIAPDALPDIVALLGATEGLFGGISVGTIRAQKRGPAILEFAERVSFVRKSGFDFETLCYLLQHKFLPNGGDDAATKIEHQLTQKLTALRSALQGGIVLGNVSVDNLKTQLARLGWYPALIDASVGLQGLAFQLSASVEVNPPQPPTPEPVIPLNLRSKFSYQKGSRLFLVDDLKNFAALMDKFDATSPDAVSAYLWAQFPSTVQTQLRDATLSINQRSTILVDALNIIVQGASIYDASRFSGVVLAPETIDLIAQNPTGPDLARLNGTLLADAYPLEITRHPAVLLCTGSLDDSDFTSLTGVFPADKITVLKDQYNAQLSNQVTIVAGMMQVFELPKFEEVLTSLTALPAIPGDFKDRLEFEMTSATKANLTLTGWLSDAEKKTISEANPANPVLVTALDNLQTKALNYLPGGLIPKFITATDAAQLLREPDVEERYRIILLRLVSRLDLDLLLAQLGAALGLDQQVVARLLDAASVNARNTKDVLTDAGFLRSDPRILIERNPGFVAEDLKDLAGLVNKLTATNPDALSSYVWARIPSAAQAQVQDATLSSDQRKAVLVDALNTILQGELIYDATRFSGIRLSAEAQALVTQNLSDIYLIALNGILLAEAYPLEIARKWPWPVQFAALELLSKIATIGNSLAITPQQWELVLSSSFAILDLLGLPTSANSTGARFDGWRQLVDFFKLRDVLSDGPVRLVKIQAALKASDVATVRKEFAEAFELDIAEVDGACSSALLKFQDVASDKDYNNPTRLLELAQFLHVVKALGTTSNAITQLIQTAPDQSVAQNVRALFMAQFDVDTALERLEPISNKLRSRQRDTLVDYLRTANSLADADELLDYFLIDVQMGTCMRTSRIKQAISSTQLFVQRCLLNLERNAVAPTDINADRWDWMKNYRVWEANRKVFLYPENWIEPELRDDKTEIFKQLESELLQEDLTEQSSLEAFRNYLDRAFDLARPVIIALWEEEEDAEHRTVHIVARDRATPHKYFYRSVRIAARDLNVKQSFNWSPWESIEGDFASGHVLVCTLDGFVCIVCPSIRQGDDGKLVIHLQAIKRTTDGWKGQKQSVDYLTHEIVPGKDIGQSFVFQPHRVPIGAGNAIRIDCFGASVSAAVSGATRNTDGAKSSASFDTVDTQFADSMRFSVLEKYVDPVNQNMVFYVRVNQLLTVTATIECDWYDSHDDVLTPNELIADPENDSRIHNDLGAPIYSTLTVQKDFPNGACELSAVNLLDAFSAAATAAALDLPWWLHCVPRRVRSIALRALIDPSLQKPGGSTYTIDVGDFGTGTISYDLVLEMLEGQVPEAARQSRSLSFSYLGSFRIEEGRSLSFYLTADTSYTASPFLLSGCEHYCSGFRSLSDPATLEYGSQIILTASSDRFFVAPSYGRPTTDEPLGAYSDSKFVLYFFEEESRYRVLPEGQAWISGGLRQLALQQRRVTDLEALQVDSTAASAPRIPFNSSSNLINFQTSPATIDLAFDSFLPSNLYDWEVFFHIPLLIATQLSQGQRFVEARRWFHTIFDPTSNAAGDEDTRYWRFKPFRDEGRGESIDEVLAAMARGETDLSDQIEAWKDNPFNPHLVARFRIRAYQWTVIIKYIQMLISWGDQLFLRDTIESINEASQLYVLAARILGARPASIPRSKSLSLSYRDLAGRLDEFSNKWIELENAVV